MKKTAMIAASALLALGSSGIAQQTQPDETKVNPGNEGTKAVGEQVPTMKGGCPESSKVDTKAPGTPATEAMSDQVPTMTADAADCTGNDGKKTKTN
jgi:hypothetical protein